MDGPFLDDAKKCLDFAGDNDEIKRKVWLMIAKHVVKNENDIKQGGFQLDFLV